MDQLQNQQLKEALIQVALIESKTLSVGLAEIIAYLQRKEPLSSLGTFRGIEEKFMFLGLVLEATARLSLGNTEHLNT